MVLHHRMNDATSSASAPPRRCRRRPSPYGSATGPRRGPGVEATGATIRAAPYGAPRPPRRATTTADGPDPPRPPPTPGPSSALGEVPVPDPAVTGPPTKPRSSARQPSAPATDERPVCSQSARHDARLGAERQSRPGVQFEVGRREERCAEPERHETRRSRRARCRTGSPPTPPPNPPGGRCGPRPRGCRLAGAASRHRRRDGRARASASRTPAPRTDTGRPRRAFDDHVTDRDRRIPDASPRQMVTSTTMPPPAPGGDHHGEEVGGRPRARPTRPTLRPSAKALASLVEGDGESGDLLDAGAQREVPPRRDVERRHRALVQVHGAATTDPAHHDVGSGRRAAAPPRRARSAREQRVGVAGARRGSGPA